MRFVKLRELLEVVDDLDTSVMGDVDLEKLHGVLTDHAAGVRREQIRRQNVGGKEFKGPDPKSKTEKKERKRGRS